MYLLPKLFHIKYAFTSLTLFVQKFKNLICPIHVIKNIDTFKSVSIGLI